MDYLMDYLMDSLTDDDLREIIARPAYWLSEKAIKVLAKELLYQRDEARGNDIYIDELE